ncbi:MAG: hypothetical protein E6R05_02570 [Candidatus Moraniibacteriota bacterium]|nr:MAG: hypothetical protein E6R05_02570 [Candidatus Moranbacteria bacterium]
MLDKTIELTHPKEKKQGWKVKAAIAIALLGLILRACASQDYRSQDSEEMNWMSNEERISYLYVEREDQSSVEDRVDRKISNNVVRINSYLNQEVFQDVIISGESQGSGTVLETILLPNNHKISFILTADHIASPTNVDDDVQFVNEERKFILGTSGGAIINADVLACEKVEKSPEFSSSIDFVDYMYQDDMALCAVEYEGDLAFPNIYDRIDPDYDYSITDTTLVIGYPGVLNFANDGGIAPPVSFTSSGSYLADVNGGDDKVNQGSHLLGVGMSGGSLITPYQKIAGVIVGSNDSNHDIKLRSIFRDIPGNFFDWYNRFKSGIMQQLRDTSHSIIE